MFRHLVLLLALLSGLGPLDALAEPGKDRFPPPSDLRVLFLGDSITYAGHYVALVEAALLVAAPERDWTIVNLGLPSETCSGLSEPSHPFPRPDVHERLDRALDKFKPDLVVACYGMNDGIYHPFSQERFEAYQQGINRLIEKVEAAGASLVLMTPPPFDPVPLRSHNKLLPADAEEFAWTGIYENYDEVMVRYAEWILDQSDRVEMVIDLRTPVLEYLAQRRETEPEFSFSSDGVHMDAAGHALLAEAILTAWGYEAGIPENETLKQLVEKREVLLRDAWLSHVGHQRPAMKEGPSLEDAKLKAKQLQRLIDKSVGLAK